MSVARQSTRAILRQACGLDSLEKLGNTEIIDCETTTRRHRYPWVTRTKRAR